MFIQIRQAHYPDASRINPHHVQDNENSGHRVTSQEDSQPDAEMTRFSNHHWAKYFTTDTHNKYSEILPETINSAGCLTHLAVHSWTFLITEEDWSVSLPCS